MIFFNTSIKFFDCDHLVCENTIYTVKGNWFAISEKVLVKPIYRKIAGQWRKVVDEKGAQGENFHIINPQSLLHISTRVSVPNLNTEDSVWGNIYRCLIQIGISEKK